MEEHIHLCPNCNTALVVPVEYWGTLMSCEECSQAFTPDQTNIQQTPIELPQAAKAYEKAVVTSQRAKSVNPKFVVFLVLVVTLGVWLWREYNYSQQDRAKALETFRYERETDRLMSQLERQRLTIKTQEDLTKSYEDTHSALAQAYRDEARAAAEISEEVRVKARRRVERWGVIGVTGVCLLFLVLPAARRPE